MADTATSLARALADRYRLGEVVGRGGMSVVYAAEDLRHERAVAIKVLSATVTQGAGDRFLREIAFLARLQHPHILPLLESGAADEQLYYVMPLIDGESLRARMERAPTLATQDILRILVDVCDALQYAHGQEIVHRDIKPENILLVGRHAVVADFGVARAVREQIGHSGLTTEGMAVGTPTYMAPEQAAADPAIDHRADLYALGVVAYEMFAGQPPFAHAAPHVVLASHVTSMPKDLARLRPDLPPELCAAVMRCLAKHPEDRWSDADALRQSFEAFLLPSGSMTPAATPRFQRRQRVLLWAVTVVAVVLAAALVRSRFTGDLDLRLANPHRLGLATDIELDPAVSPDGRMIAYTSGRIGAMRIRVRQLAGGTPVTVAGETAGNQRWPRWSSDGSRLTFQAGGTVYTVPALGGAVQAMVDGDASSPAGDFSWSPDGSKAAFTRGGSVFVRPDSTNRAVELVHDATAHSLAWSPDGAFLAYVSGNVEFVFSDELLGNIAPSTVMVVPANGGTAVALTDGRSMAMSPVWVDGHTVAFIEGNATTRDLFALRVSRRGRPVGDPVRLTTGLRLHSTAVYPDGSRLVYLVLDYHSNVWSVAQPHPGDDAISIADARPVTTGDQVIEDFDVFAVGSFLLFDSNRAGSQDIWLQTDPSTSPTRLTQDPTDEFGPVWSPTGREVAYYSVRDGVRHLFVIEVAGGTPVQVTFDTLGDHQPKWSPDGDQLVFNRRDDAGRDRPFIVARSADGTWGDARPLTDEYGTASHWSSDGWWIAFTDEAGNLRVIDAAGGPSRALASPADVGGFPIRRPHWLLGEPAILARVEAPGGTGGIWRFSVAGDPPLEMVRFDDPDRPVYRTDIAAGQRRVYFLVSQFASSMWSITIRTTERSGTVE